MQKLIPKMLKQACLHWIVYTGMSSDLSQNIIGQQIKRFSLIMAPLIVVASVIKLLFFINDFNRTIRITYAASFGFDNCKKLRSQHMVESDGGTARCPGAPMSFKSDVIEPDSDFLQFNLHYNLSELTILWITSAT